MKTERMTKEKIKEIQRKYGIMDEGEIVSEDDCEYFIRVDFTGMNREEMS